MKVTRLACFSASSTHSLTHHNHLTSTTTISSFHVPKKLFELGSTNLHYCDFNEMEKHQENKEKGKSQVKDPFSASEQLKSMNYETKRMEKINQKKFAKDKANRIAKETASKTACKTTKVAASKTAKHRKQRKINQPQHPLAAAFSGQFTILHSTLYNL